MFMPVPDPKEMGLWDAKAMALGIPEAVLMENAAREAHGVLRQYYGPLHGCSILLLAGSGNNGGDAACLARHLADARARPLLLSTVAPEQRRGAARHYVELLSSLSLPGEVLARDAPVCLARFQEILLETAPDIIIDGLLGTGFQGDLRPREAGLVRAINAWKGKCFVLALDVPSGLNAQSGKPCPEAIQADATVSFQAAKQGLVLPEASPYTGILAVRTIGIPQVMRREIPAACRLWLPESHGDPTDGYELHVGYKPEEWNQAPMPQLPAKKFLPAHKGEAGRVLILGGSPEYGGAPWLAARGALRTGAGLVALGTPHNSLSGTSPGLAEVITLPLESGNETLWPSELSPKIVDHMASSHAVVIGPGMGRNNGSALFLEKMLTLKARPPLVLDADALYALAQKPSLLGLLQKSDVLTPHPGEAATLLGMNSHEIQADRFQALARLQALASAVWILKGVGTLIGVPGQAVTIVPMNVPNLAVAGSGDVLAGCLGSLLAGGYGAEMAAVIGTHLHARAGQLLAAQFPCRGNMAGEIADALPQARLGLEPLACTSA